MGSWIARTKPLWIIGAFFLPLAAIILFLMWRPNSRVIDVSMAVAPNVDASSGDLPDDRRHVHFRPSENQFDDIVAQADGHHGGGAAETIPAPLLAVVVPKQRVAVRALEDGVITFVAGQISQDAGTVAPVVKLDDTRVAADIQRQRAVIAAAGEQVARAEAALGQAEFTRDVKKRLAEGGAIARNVHLKWQFEAEAAAKSLAEARHREAVEKAQLDVLQEQLAAFTIYPPIGGRIAEVVRGEGEFVRKGEVVLWMESKEKRLKVVLDQQRAGANSAAAITGFVIHDGIAPREFVRNPQLPLGDPGAAWTLYFEDGSDANQLRDFVTGQILPGSIVLDSSGDRP